MKKKRTSALSVIIVILLLLIISVALITNLVFTLSSTPHLFGYYVTIQDDDSMEPDINNGTAVISKAIDSNTALSAGTKILCELNDGTVDVRYISSIVDNEDGTISYIPSLLNSENTDSDVAISQNNILGVCTIKSDEFATFIKFARSFYGIGALLILPCVILVIMLIVSISKSSKSEKYDEEDSFEQKYSKGGSSEDTLDDYFDDEFADDGFNDEPVDNSKTTTFSTSDIDRKKSSISQNFERKKVDSNSPYQKAVERERTMQFRAQKEAGFNDFYANDLEGSDMTPRAVANISDDYGYSAPQENHSATGSYPEAIKVENYNTEYDTAHMGAHDVETEEYRPEHEQGVESSRPELEPERKHREAPNLDDILMSTSSDDSDYVRPSHDNINSIDELISVIEKEKKKLK